MLEYSLGELRGQLGPKEQQLAEMRERVEVGGGRGAWMAAGCWPPGRLAMCGGGQAWVARWRQATRCDAGCATQLMVTCGQAPAHTLLSTLHLCLPAGATAAAAGLLLQGMEGLVAEVSRSHGEVSLELEGRRQREAAMHREAGRQRAALAEAQARVRWGGQARGGGKETGGRAGEERRQGSPCCDPLLLLLCVCVCVRAARFWQCGQAGSHTWRRHLATPAACC